MKILLDFETRSKCDLKGRGAYVYLMKILLDFETRSECDLKGRGAYVYSKEIHSLLCLAYKIGGDEVRLWTPDDPDPDDLFHQVVSRSELHAHNVAFERLVWKNYCVPVLGWPEVRDDQWHCTAAQGAAAALPRSLRDCSETLGLAKQKDMAGHQKMLRLSKPKEPSAASPGIWDNDPAKLEAVYSYCVDDVLTEDAIDKAVPALTASERAVWLLDQKINDRGVYLDVGLAQSALEVWRMHTSQLNDELATITAGEVVAATEVAKIQKFCGTLDVQKDTVRDLLAEDTLNPVCRRVLEIRQEAGLSSIAKFAKMLGCVGDDSRVRGIHMYHGATTGRWAGRLVQFQNVPRGVVDADELQMCIDLVHEGDTRTIEVMYGSVGKVLSSLIRPTICAPPGKRLLVVDFAGIEARGIAWLAGEKETLERFENGEDLYVELAKTIYGTSEVSKAQRALGKCAVLGCGYQMGAETFHKTCQKWSLDVSEELAATSVEAYRETNPAIVEFWSGLNDAAKQAVQTPEEITTCRGISYVSKFGWLWCGLPSGRKIAYRSPFIAQKTMPSPPFPAGTKRDCIFFTGVGIGGRGEEQNTYGGSLAENVTQAICRDLLVAAMLRLEAAGYPVVMHVHDEVVVEVPEGFGSVEEMESIMCEVPEWAEGFPIAAEGFECQRYHK